MVKVVLTFCLFVLVSINATAVAFSFRIQCSKKGNPNLLSVFNKIPERQSYIMPTGTTMYFSGGYFADLGKAKMRLAEVHQLGITDAFIRVFRNHTYVSDQVSAVLLADLSFNYEKIQLKRKRQDSIQLAEARIKEQEALKKSNRGKLLAENESNDIQSKKNMLKAKEGSEEKKSLNESSSDSTLKVKESPVYKILVAEGKVGEMMDEKIGDLNEIVYENRRENKVFFTVGYYNSVKKAEEALLNYQKGGKNKHFKVVGVYLNNVISLSMAKELQIQFAHQQSNRKNQK